ncbi:hypothetical protein [Kribbella deserti]|uniref:Uncharacterized protein n=1 Tax=Kribbella deserti TaxID=1926257 RepID=A0ABV6QXT4_9ACTN
MSSTSEAATASQLRVFTMNPQPIDSVAANADQGTIAVVNRAVNGADQLRTAEFDNYSTAIERCFPLIAEIAKRVYSSEPEGAFPLDCSATRLEI